MRKSERRELIQLLDKLMEHEEVVIESYTIRGDIAAEKDSGDQVAVADARSTWKRANRMAIRLEAMAKNGGN